jgi:hypothetical protein
MVADFARGGVLDCARQLLAVSLDPRLRRQALAPSGALLCGSLTARRCRADGRKIEPFCGQVWLFSLYFSLLPGNLPGRDGFDTYCIRHQSLAALQRFPGAAPNNPYRPLPSGRLGLWISRARPPRTLWPLCLCPPKSLFLGNGDRLDQRLVREWKAARLRMPPWRSHRLLLPRSLRSPQLSRFGPEKVPGRAEVLAALAWQ